ncbi:hypothetical protein DE146DRAFT_716434 [Phaeosphaeria sp. MPI-PUGE-AT-0046c]|nr:hypothetical protein DE146DRAFT_716434 [Phaeosphaeria sp. MPI-PUGE-AT-0046c]
MHPPSQSSSSVSVSSLVQYVFFAAIIYVLAGAPLSSFFRESNTFSGVGVNSDASAHVGNPDHLVIPEADLTCDEHAYKGVYILSREPLVVYIEGFVSSEEAKHVVDASNPLFKPSTIFNQGQETLDTSVRNSQKAAPPRDHTVKCIEERARTFQGWKPFVFIEKLWAQRYATGGHYTYHYDWSTANKGSGRVSSFMVYLEANCTGGGTHFPRLQRPGGKEWCKFIDCDNEDPRWKDGIIFKPVAGNAVYWENMRADETWYPESWHAGLPVETGTKVGLNIWSWLQTGYVPSNVGKA